MDKIKVFLIDFQANIFSSSHEEKSNQVVLPIGLMYLSAWLKSKMNNIEMKLVKSNIDFGSVHELLSIIDIFSPDIIGIRSMSLDMESMFEYVKYIHGNYLKHNYVIALGGPITNSNTKEVFNSGLFDYITIGEGERAFLEIVKAFYEQRPINSSTKGIVYSVDNYENDYIENLDEIPFPDYSLIDFDKYDKYTNYGHNRNRQGVIFTSRGCPYKCIYCHNLFGNKARLRSPENVFNEMRFLYENYNIKDIFFVDDIFNIDYKRAMKIFNLVIHSKIPFKLYFPNGIRGDIIDKDYIDRMVEAGTIYVTYAVETASERLQKIIKKNLDLIKLKENIKYTCEKEILVNAFFLFGLPGETAEEAMLTLKYAEELDKLNFPFIFFSRYYEGTEMYYIALENGFSKEILDKSINSFYHEVSHYHTPTLSRKYITYIKNFFLYKIFFNEKRISNMLKLQKKFYNEGDILDYLNSMYNVNVDSVIEFETYVKEINQSSYMKNY